MTDGLDGLEEIIGQGVLSLSSLSLRVILGRLDVEDILFQGHLYMNFGEVNFLFIYLERKQI